MMNNEEQARAAGLNIYEETISHFTHPSFLEQLQNVVQGNSLAQVASLPEQMTANLIYRDMVSDPNWLEEFWVLNSDESVSRVDDNQFHERAEIARFSHSDTLRSPSRSAFALRGFLAGLKSQQVSEAFSQTLHNCGPVNYKTADIARYRPGHYLRRHDDLYDGRIFGLVFFFHDLWEATYGARLIAEKPDGRSVVVSPQPGTYALMRLAHGHFHQVEVNTSPAWDRYSVAVHFSGADV